jgi:hypothetical protein
MNLMLHLEAMLEEYTERFEKTHKCQAVYSQLLEMTDSNLFPQFESTPLKMAMPDEFKIEGNPVKSYRDYYSTKERIRYPKNKIPEWFLARRNLPFQTI